MKSQSQSVLMAARDLDPVCNPHPSHMSPAIIGFYDSDHKGEWEWSGQPITRTGKVAYSRSLL